MNQIFGQLLDKEGRCQHYHGQLDVVALKCFFCQRYYACYLCHNELEEHDFTAYPKSLTDDKVVLCGACQTELTIVDYQSVSSCLACGHSFNPGCKLHEAIYFREDC